MTSKDYFAREAIEAYRMHGERCMVCGKPATQLAHRIPQRTSLLDRYGWRIIHSRHNRLPACTTACNAQLQCNATSEIEMEQIAKSIMGAITQEKE